MCCYRAVYESEWSTAGSDRASAELGVSAAYRLDIHPRIVTAPIGANGASDVETKVTLQKIAMRLCRKRRPSEKYWRRSQPLYCRQMPLGVQIHLPGNMAVFLQINTNRSREAQALALHTLKEKEADVLCISEPNRIPDHPGWVGSTDGKCALYLQPNLQVLRTGSDIGIAWAELETLRVYSCYISPNCRPEEFDDFLEQLHSSAREVTTEVIVSGDFNGHSQVWGSSRSDRRGEALLDMAESLNLVILNDGRTPTFPRGNSFLDLTFATPGIIRKLGTWEVLEEESMSDHQYVFYSLKKTEQITQPGRSGWSWRKLDTDKLDSFVAETRVPRTSCAKTSSLELSGMLIDACNSCMPKASYKWGKKPCYWWTQTIAELRKECMRLRRKLRRFRARHEDCATSVEEYRLLKRNLKM